MDKEIGSEKKDTPALNEEILGKLLEAAFVLQEHNRLMQEMELRVEPETRKREGDSSSSPAASPSETLSTASPAPNDYTLTLAQIVETQHKIQLRHLELKEAAALVAERVVEITRAGGAAIGILEGKKIRYCAVAGSMTLPIGTEIPAEKSLCGISVKTGQVVRLVDGDSEFLVDRSECRRRGIESLIAVPVYHEGGIAGGLELYYATAQAFTEQDIHTCQLMAGLVTEALARAEELTWKQSLASERAVMLDALEKLKPNLAALVDPPAIKDSVSREFATKDSVPQTSVPKVGSATAALRTAPYTCRKCGHTLVGGEVFCGKCGTPRGGGSEAPDLQSKVASLWEMQEAAQKATTPKFSRDEVSHDELSTSSDHNRVETPLASSIEQKMPHLFAPTESSQHKSLTGSDMLHGEMEDSGAPRIQLDLEADFEENAHQVIDHDEQIGDDHQSGDSPSLALVKSPASADWSSAANAREFLQQLAEGRPGAFDRFWKARRGDIYLALALILVTIIIGWAIWSDHSVAATGSSAAGAHHKAPDADLSLLDRMLIGMGLAEAPQPPDAKGNPETQVWVDLHTALYYCPGTDLYGKTPKGKYTSQRDAQLDQFEPAYRKACE